MAPISSRRVLDAFLYEDLKAHHVDDRTSPLTWRWYYRWNRPVLYFQRKLRIAEFATNTAESKFARLNAARLRFSVRRTGERLGFTIPINVFGPGLSIAHVGTIVVNPDSRVGANCRIHPSTCLGWKGGGVPMLGDNCYIGPGAKLIGGVTLGNRTIVGANAVVTRSYPEGDCTLVGIPARPVYAKTLVNSSSLDGGLIASLR
jgi:serine O-acetyltransferase